MRSKKKGENCGQHRPVASLAAVHVQPASLAEQANRPRRLAAFKTSTSRSRLTRFSPPTQRRSNGLVSAAPLGHPAPRSVSIVGNKLGGLPLGIPVTGSLLPDALLRFPPLSCLRGLADYKYKMASLPRLLAYGLQSSPSNSVVCSSSPFSLRDPPCTTGEGPPRTSTPTTIDRQNADANGAKRGAHNETDKVDDAEK